MIDLYSFNRLLVGGFEPLGPKFGGTMR